jgi:hypothetical protein
MMVAAPVRAPHAWHCAAVVRRPRHRPRRQQQQLLQARRDEVFLSQAEIIGQSSGKGVTDTIRATLSDGRLTHDAQIQTVDFARNLFEAGAKSEVHFKDTYKVNIAAYELARLVGLDNVPMSVERSYRGKPGDLVAHDRSSWTAGRGRGSACQEEGESDPCASVTSLDRASSTS